MPLPVAHYDREPRDEEALIFTSAPANQWNEGLVGIDLVTARRVGKRLVDALEVWAALPVWP